MGSHLVVEEATKPHYIYQGPRTSNDLLALMRCSRRLYRLGEPILYRKLLQTTLKTLPRFIETISAHPNLADHVRSVNLTDLGPAELDLRDDPPGWVREILGVRDAFSDTHPGPIVALPSPNRTHFSQEELGTFEAAMHSLVSARAASRVQGIKHESWDTIAALVLCLLPNVEVVEVEKCQEMRWQSPEYSYNLLSYTSTPKLRSLSISYQKRTCENGLLAIPIRLLALPTLHSFSGDMMQENSWKNHCPDRKFSIKSLRLDRSNFSPQALANLVNSCPELEFLKYEHDEDHGRDRDEYPFFPSHFDEALASLKGVLKELILYKTALEPGPLATMNQAQFGIIKSLKNFKELTSLSITAQLLLGPQRMKDSAWYEISLQHSAVSQTLNSCLPPSLEHLKLKSCGANIYEQMRLLMEVRQLVVPRLKSVIVEFVHLRPGGGRSKTFTEYLWRGQLKHSTSSISNEVNKLCQEQGVSFDVWYN